MMGHTFVLMCLIGVANLVMAETDAERKVSIEQCAVTQSFTHLF